MEPGTACLTLHQPWASLLVHGIKRIEGRSWPSPMRGRLWIHAASKVPDAETIKAMETFYRELYALDGVKEITFPEFYPTSVLLGSVEVVGCLKRDELNCREDLSMGVRLEGQTDYCWLCESPQKLVVPLQMRGRQGIYNIQRSIFEGASRALKPVRGPAPIRFPSPAPFESSPVPQRESNGKPKVSKSAALEASIAGARQAATQFRRQEIQNLKTQQVLGEQNRVQRNRSPGQSTDSSSSSSASDLPAARWGPSTSSRSARETHMQIVRPTSRILAQALRASNER